MNFLVKRFENFRFSLFITTICLTLAIAMIFASRWQWRRYLYKVDLVATYQSNAVNPPLPFPVNGRSAQDFKNVLDRKITVTGRYDFDRQMIIINRTHPTGPGFWLLTPFILDQTKTAVIVSRGFIPFRDDSPSSWEKYNFVEQETLEAVVQPTVPDRWGFVPAETGDDSAQQHRKWRYVDVEKIARELPYPVIPSVFLQRLGKPQQGDFPAESVSIDVPPSTHFWYTFEWLFLATAVIVIGVILQTLPRRDQKLLLLLVFSASLFAGPGRAHAETDLVAAPTEAGIDQRLDTQVDLSLPFTDQSGKTLPLREFLIPNRPTILVPVYFTCPRLCSLTQDGVAALLKQLTLKLGTDFRVISVSFNPQDSPEQAAVRAKDFTGLIGDKGDPTGWKFLVGNDEHVRELMEQIGFRSTREGDEFIHAAAIIILTPEGRISHYFYGIKFEPRDVSFALIDASRGKIGSPIDSFLLYCFQFDAVHGKYSLAVMNVTRVISLGVGVLLALFLLHLKRKEVAGG